MNQYKTIDNNDDAVTVAMSRPSYKKGDIVLVDLGFIQDDCIVRKVRPAIIQSCTQYNSVSPIMQIIPMSKKFKNMDSPYHVFIDKEDCEYLNASGVAMVEQLTTIDRSKVIHYIGRIKENTLINKLNRAIINQLNLEV